MMNPSLQSCLLLLLPLLLFRQDASAQLDPLDNPGGDVVNPNTDQLTTSSPTSSPSKSPSAPLTNPGGAVVDPNTNQLIFPTASPSKSPTASPTSFDPNNVPCTTLLANKEVVMKISGTNRYIRMEKAANNYQVSSASAASNDNFKWKIEAHNSAGPRVVNLLNQGRNLYVQMKAIDKIEGSTSGVSPFFLHPTDGTCLTFTITIEVYQHGTNNEYWLSNDASNHIIADSSNSLAMLVELEVILNQASIEPEDDDDLSSEGHSYHHCWNLPLVISLTSTMFLQWLLP